MPAGHRLLAACLLALLTGGTAPAQPLPDRPLDRVPLEDLSGFRPVGPEWQVAGDAWTLWDSTALALEPGAGVLVHAAPAGQGEHLVTAWQHGDLELELEFLLPRGADTGLYLQGRYEVQLSDSWGVGRPGFRDAGGISRRHDPARPAGERGFEGHPPRADAARAPGLWQQLRVVFQAPRFDEAGRRVARARVVEVVLNGVRVQESVEITGPTQGAPFGDEAPAGPLAFQGGGPAAFRNVRYRPYETAAPIVVSDVRYTLYNGEFAGLAEMSRAEPARAGESYGYVWDLFGTRADRFGARWEGRIEVPVSGEYRFGIGFNWVDEIPYEEDAVPGHGLLTIGGREVAAHAGKEPFAWGSVHLEQGVHPFTLAYFKNRRLWRPIVFFRAEGPGMPPQLLNAPRTVPEPETSAPPLAVEPAREPYVLRSFVEHGGRKRVNAVSVGDPLGVHYTLDLESGGLLHAWKGAFADVGAMWHGRGEQQVAAPLGHRVPLAGGPALALLAEPGTPWPDSLPEGAFRFRGYALDAAGRPTFRYTLGGVEVTDRLDPAREGRALARRLELSAPAAPRQLWLRVAEGAEIRERRPGVYAVDGRYFVRVEEPARAGALLRTRDGRRELLLPLRLEAGRATAGYEIIW